MTQKRCFNYCFSKRDSWKIIGEYVTPPLQLLIGDLLKISIVSPPPSFFSPVSSWTSLRCLRRTLPSFPKLMKTGGCACHYAISIMSLLNSDPQILPPKAETTHICFQELYFLGKGITTSPSQISLLSFLVCSTGSSNEHPKWKPLLEEVLLPNHIRFP